MPEKRKYFVKSENRLLVEAVTIEYALFLV